MVDLHSAHAWRALLAVLWLAGPQSAAAQAPRRFLELHAWGGYSAFANPPQSPASAKADGLGLRSLEVALWPSASLRLFGRFDNSLSLDNLTLLRAGRRVPTWSGGGLVNWGGHFTTVLRAGRRTLPGGVGQTLLGMEQVAYTSGGSALKAGAEVDPRADHRTEWVAHAGINAPAGDRLRIEPVLFYARSGIGGERQWRALLASEWRLGRRSSIGAGVAGGQISESPAGFNGTVWDGYARVTTAVAAESQAHLLLRHERAPGASPLTSVSLGLSLVLSRS
jgi:hypothetical protein